MSFSKLSLENKTAVVIGGTSGIGRAIAHGLAEAGASVICTSRRAEQVEKTAVEIENFGRKTLRVTSDVSDRASLENLLEKCVTEFGRVDILVNCAGRTKRAPTLDFAEEDWTAILETNLTGTLRACQIFGRQMRALGRGSLVHVASIAGHNAQGQSGAYSVSKAGVIMLSRQLANEWGPHGIRSNVINPGMVITPMSQAFYDTPGVTERRSAVVPMRRVGMPQDMADAILFLASDRASYVNGDEIMVDGGYANMLMNLVPRPGFE